MTIGKPKTVPGFASGPEPAAVGNDAQRDLGENDAGHIFGADTVVSETEVRP